MIKLYDFPSSVCAAKVRLVLTEKNLDWESQSVDIFKGEQFAPWYLELNPNGVVPTLVHEGRVVRESAIVCEYLDEAFPEPSLKPASNVLRARMRIWCKDVETFLLGTAAAVSFPAFDRYEVMKLTPDGMKVFYERHPSANMRKRKQSWIERGYDSQDARASILTYNKFLQKMEMELAKSPWLAGENYSLADAAATPYLAMLEMLDFQAWWRDMPRVGAWYARVKRRPSFQRAIVDVIPDRMTAAMRAGGAEAWPQVEAILATAEPFTGKSPWAMRAAAI